MDLDLARQLAEVLDPKWLPDDIVSVEGPDGLLPDLDHHHNDGIWLTLVHGMATHVVLTSGPTWTLWCNDRETGIPVFAEGPNIGHAAARVIIRLGGMDPSLNRGGA